MMIFDEGVSLSRVPLANSPGDQARIGGLKAVGCELRKGLVLRRKLDRRVVDRPRGCQEKECLDGDW